LILTTKLEKSKQCTGPITFLKGGNLNAIDLQTCFDVQEKYPLHFVWLLKPTPKRVKPQDEPKGF